MRENALLERAFPFFPTREVENCSMTAFTTAAPPAAPVEAPASARVQNSFVLASQPPKSRVALIFLGLALVLGGIVRAYSILCLPFAFGDGGMFWVATRAITDARFALPAYLTYPTPTPDLPFCYPPLSFYEAAFLAKVGVPMALIFRWLPWAWSVGTIWAFGRLARTVWRDQPNGEWAAGAATLIWALLPWSFFWMVMGGGLTRAPGLFWAFLAVEAALRLWRDGEARKWWPLLFFLALALATHLERARFAVVAVSLVWLFYGRTWRGAAQLAGALVGAALVTAPWWGLCLARFGLDPFLQAAHSGGSGWREESGWRALLEIARFNITGEAVLPWAHLVGAAGLLWCLWRRQWLLPVWFVAILLLEARSGRNFIIAPLALGAGILLANAPRARVPVLAALTCWLCLLSILVQQSLFGLTTNDLAAIQWAKRHTPPQARFLVFPKHDWGMDMAGEWFPALAGRAGVLTAQGTEWLPNDEFTARRDRHDAVRRRRHSWQAVEKWTTRNQVRFDWVWRPDGVDSMEPGDGWERVWSRGPNAIWRRARR